jgi:hypothetical protein
VAVVGGEGLGACSIIVGEGGFRGADLRSVEGCPGGFEERGGRDVVRCFEGGEGREMGQACDAVNTEFCGAVQRDAFIWVSRPAVRVMEVGGISFELSR